jgi:hypothetical protein
VVELRTLPGLLADAKAAYEDDAAVPAISSSLGVWAATEAAGEQMTVSLSAARASFAGQHRTGSQRTFPYRSGFVRKIFILLQERCPRGQIALIEQLGEVQMVYVVVDTLATPIIAKLPGTEVLYVGTPSR